PASAMGNVLPLIQQIQASGIKSLRGVARALTARGVKTACGGDWSAVQVADILRRALGIMFAFSSQNGQTGKRPASSALWPKTTHAVPPKNPFHRLTPSRRAGQ